MKNTILGTFVLILASPFFADAASLVQSNGGESATVSFTSSVTAGDLLVVQAVGQGTPTVTDSLGNSYAAEGSESGTCEGGNSYITTYAAVSNFSGSDTVTIVDASGLDPGAVIQEFSGMPPSIYVDTTAAAVNTDTLSITTSADDLITVGGVCEGSGGNANSIASPFTFTNSTGNYGSGSYGFLNAGTYNPTLNMAQNMVAVAFCTDSGCGGGGGGGGSATSTTGYIPSEDEDLFIFGLFLFIFSVPFWERAFTLTKGLHDV